MNEEREKAILHCLERYATKRIVLFLFQPD